MGNKWRLSGGLGIDPDPTPHNQEVMLQGIGMPLRPVDNVPLDDRADLGDQVAQNGLFMTFYPQGYEDGKYYPKGSAVTSGEWTMVANILTLEYPFPIPDGNPTFGLPAFTPTTQSDLSAVYSGHIYTFSQPVWVKTLRIWVPQITLDTSYRVILATTVLGQDTVTTVFENPVLTAGAWDRIALLNQLVTIGTTMQIYIDGLNSGADNEVTGGWSFTGQDNTSAPIAQAWNHDNANATLRIDKTDLDTTDRSTELSGITVDSTIQFIDTNNPSAFNQYRVTGTPTDAGTYWSYPVILQEQGEGGVPIGTTTMTATVPVPQATEYAEEVGVPTPTWASVQGYLAYNGTEQPAGQTNSYGVDIECEPAIVPLDWTVFAYNTL